MTKRRTRYSDTRSHDVFKHVDMKGKTNEDCWPWTGYLRPGNRGEKRGIISINGKQHYAYRVVWELYNGRELRPNEVVRHTCDNTLCCNPAHLIAGTQADNVQDMLERERVGHKIADIKLVMHLLETGVSSLAIAEHLEKSNGIKIDASMIRKIRRRVIYKHIEWPWGDEQLKKKKP